METDESAAYLQQRCGFVLLDHAAAARGVQGPAAAEPKGNMRHRLEAVDGEIPVFRCGHRRTRTLLLVGVARHQPSEPAPGHVDKSRAVDPALAHPAPEVRRAEVGARLLDGVTVAG